MGQSDLRGEVLDRAVKRYRAAVGFGVERKVMLDAGARRAKIALLEARSEIHQLSGKHGHEGIGGSWIALEFSEKGFLRIEAHAGASLSMTASQ